MVKRRSSSISSAFEAVVGEEVGDFFRPFDDDYSAGEEQLVEADDFEVFFGGDAIGVHVEDGLGRGLGGLTVNVEEDVGGGGDEGGVCDACAQSDAAGEMGFAGAEVSMEGDAGIGRGELAEEQAEAEGFVDAVGAELHPQMIAKNSDQGFCVVAASAFCMSS
jgi:hypothetical protein